MGLSVGPEYKDSYSEKKALRAEVTKVLASNPRLRYMGDEGEGWILALRQKT